MSNHNNQMIAYVAIKRSEGGASFAYLPRTTNVSFPQGWEWSIIDGEIQTEDVSGVAASMRYSSVEETCRLMSQGTGITWEPMKRITREMAEKMLKRCVSCGANRGSTAGMPYCSECGVLQDAPNGIMGLFTSMEETEERSQRFSELRRNLGCTIPKHEHRHGLWKTFRTTDTKRQYRFCAMCGEQIGE